MNAKLMSKTYKNKNQNNKTIFKIRLNPLFNKNAQLSPGKKSLN